MNTSMRKTLATITSSINSKKSTSRTLSEENQEKSVRDIKLSIEFKTLKQNAPSGVYILPSLHNIRLFHGVIFLRRGSYANGVFKFIIKLPPLYNGINTWPNVTFTTPVYNPFINPVTGELNIKDAFPRWDPQKHYLVTLLTYIKKIFYMKRFDDKVFLNKEAYDTAIENPELHKNKIRNCVLQSQSSLIHNNDTVLSYPIEIIDDNNIDVVDIDAKILSEQVQYNLFWEMIKEEYLDDLGELNTGKIVDCIKDVLPNGSDEDDKCCIKLY